MHVECPEQEAPVNRVVSDKTLALPGDSPSTPDPTFIRLQFGCLKHSQYNTAIRIKM